MEQKPTCWRSKGLESLLTDSGQSIVELCNSTEYDEFVGSGELAKLPLTKRLKGYQILRSLIPPSCRVGGLKISNLMLDIPIHPSVVAFQLIDSTP